MLPEVHSIPERRTNPFKSSPRLNDANEMHYGKKGYISQHITLKTELLVHPLRPYLLVNLAKTCVDAPTGKKNHI